MAALLEQNALKSVNNCFNANIYSYLETSGGQSSKSIFKCQSYFQTSLWDLKTVVFLHCCLRVNVGTFLKAFCYITAIRKELLSRINQIHYWKSFCKTHENCNYLQLIKLIELETYLRKIVKKLLA